jgi:hypothetical protein
VRPEEAAALLRAGTLAGTVAMVAGHRYEVGVETLGTIRLGAG